MICGSETHSNSELLQKKGRWWLYADGKRFGVALGGAE